MDPATAILSWKTGECLGSMFLGSLVANLASSLGYDVGRFGTAKLAELVAGATSFGQLPPNHDLRKLARRSLRAALDAVYTACAAGIGDKDPLFPAICKAWKAGNLWSRPLIEVRDTDAHKWLARLGKVIDDDKLVRALDGGGDLTSENVTALAAEKTDAAIVELFSARLSDWVALHVEGKLKVQRPKPFADGLARGFPFEGGGGQRIPVYAAWCLFFREGLKTDPKAFTAFVTSLLTQLAGAPAVDAQQIADRAVALIGERNPGSDYFDRQFEALKEHVTNEADRVIDQVTKAFNQVRIEPQSLPRLPPPQNEFVGRETEVAAVLAAFRKGGNTAGIAGLRGQGGIGKTALALHVGQQLAADFPHGQVYIDLRGTAPEPTNPRAAMESILLQFDRQQSFKDASDAQVAAHYRNALGSKRVLLLLDNAEGARQVTPLIPGGLAGVLVTSRRKFKLGSVDPIYLDVLTKADAAALARSVCPRLTDAEARDLGTACGRLALAIRIAATQLSNYDGIPAATLVAELKSDRLKFLDAVETDDPEGLPFARRAIELSLEKLPSDLRTFWSHLGVFPADFNPLGAAAVCLDVENPDAAKAHKTLEDLRGHALVELDPDTARYSLHDLARDYAWHRGLPDDQARHDVAKRHATAFARILAAADDLFLQGRQLEGLAVFDAEVANVTAGQRWATAHAATDSDAAGLTANYPDAGVYVLDLRLHSRTRIEWLTAAVDACHHLGDRRGEGNALGNLGIAHAALGDARTAIGYYEQHLVVAREIGDRRGEGNSLGNLGNAHAALGDARTAIGYHEQALTVSREIGDRRGEGNTLGNLGNAHAALGDARTAIGYHEQALTVSREIGDRRGEGQDLGNLGIAQAALGDARTAIGYYEQHLAVAREIGDRRGEGNSLGNLGIAHAALGDARTAIGYYEQHLVVAREIGDRRGEGNSLGNLGIAHADLGDARTAIGYHEQALTVSREIGDRRGEGNTLGNLGVAHAALGDARTAIGYYERCLVIAREIGDRRGEGSTLGNLGNAHAALGDARTAIGYHEQALTVSREIGDRRGEGRALFNGSIGLAKQSQWCPAADKMEAAAKIFAEIEDPNAARAAEFAQMLRQACASPPAP